MKIIKNTSKYDTKKLRQLFCFIHFLIAKKEGRLKHWKHLKIAIRNSSRRNSGCAYIGQVFGSKIIQAKILMHGKTSLIKNKRLGVLKGIKSKFTATRYHSLIVDRATLSKDLIVTATTENNIIMGLMHNKYQVHGVQFHPESINTKVGMKIIENFVKI